MQVTDLRIYNISLELSKEILQLVSKIPNNWRIKDIKQIKTSAPSVPSNITEGFGRRFYPRDYIRFLNIALGSSDETQTHLKSLFSQNLINESEFMHYLRAYKDLSIRILNFINFHKKKHGITI